MKVKLLTASMVLLLLVPFLFGGCSFVTGETSQTTPAAASGEGFTIYLTKYDILPDKMDMLSHIEKAEQPVISSGDIISYDWDTHTIEITADAYDRVKQTRDGVSGQSFLACVDGKPVYCGAFWSMLSSMSFNGVTIIKPFNITPENGYFIEISLGYPSGQFFKGEDPRDNPAVLDALKVAGKLK